MLKRKETKLGKMLFASGLLTEEQANRLETEYNQTNKSLLTILKQEANLDSIKELLTYRVSVPFLREETEDLQKSLVAEGVFTADELEELLLQYKPKETDLGTSLVEAGIVSEEQLTTAKERQQATGFPLERVLINLQYVTPKNISDIVRYQQEANQDGIICRILLQRGFISEEKLQTALAKKKKDRVPLGKILIDSGYLTIDQVKETFDKYLVIPYVDLTTETISTEIAHLLPEPFIREHAVLPVKREKRTLWVAMLDPLDMPTIDDMALLTGCQIKPMLVEEGPLKTMTDKLFPSEEQLQAAAEKEGSETFGVVPKETAVGAPVTQGPGPVVGRDQLAQQVDNVSTISLVSSIIETAVRSRATDIHLEPQVPRMRIRYRIDGMLHDVMTLAVDQQLPVQSRIKVLANMDITERRRPQDGHITHRMDGKDYDIRVATLPTHFGEKIVLRVLDESQVLKGLPQLGFEPRDLEIMRSLIHRPYGMVLVTGPIGSGKTTTLYSALNEVNVLTANIVTIEDPIEYQLPGINQVQVDPKVDLTFVSGLRAVLRQDANILMVGEIRDAETAAIAVRAALTGHLLFATLHTNDAPSAVTTLTHLGVKPFLIASSVIGVIAQRLVRTICPHCKEEYEPEVGLKEELGPLPEASRGKLSRGKGCESCFRTGYIGRTGVYEVLQMSDTIRGLITDGESEVKIKKTAMAEGMSTIRDSCIKKVLAGITTVDELIRTVYL
ncbi:MAG: GspE/PulE family protein [bacterium]|nr:GspE/PulE family protein [bacterium]